MHTPPASFHGGLIRPVGGLGVCVYWLIGALAVPVYVDNGSIFAEAFTPSTSIKNAKFRTRYVSSLLRRLTDNVPHPHWQEKKADDAEDRWNFRVG